MGNVKRGKRPSNGGAREGAGRKPGIPNLSTAEFRSHAREYTHEAIEFYAKVMRGESYPLQQRMEHGLAEGIGLI